MELSKTFKAISASVVGIATAASIYVGTVSNPTVSTYNQPTPNELNYNSHKLIFLIWHCAASSTKLTAQQVVREHTAPRSQGGFGWDRPGYNVFFEGSGKKVVLVPFNTDSILQPSERANGAGEFNGIALHFCYAGGIDKYGKEQNNMTYSEDTAQKAFLLQFVKDHPNIIICGHNQICAKACPSFNVPQKLRSYGIPDRNIYWWNNWYPLEKIEKLPFQQNAVNTLVKQPD